MIFKLGELFCGPGGIAVGATNARIEDDAYGIVHQWANDYDANTCATYRKNICPSAPGTVYHEDVRKLSHPTCKVLEIWCKKFDEAEYGLCTYSAKELKRSSKCM